MVSIMHVSDFMAAAHGAAPPLSSQVQFRHVHSALDLDAS
jgi:hypothetical protein